MSLRRLPTLTALQRLHLDVKGSSAGDAAELADALPQLAQHLTALQLRGHLTADACLTGLSSLTNLQALNLRDFRCTAASFARLPRSLRWRAQAATSRPLRVPQRRMRPSLPLCWTLTAHLASPA